MWHAFEHTTWLLSWLHDWFELGSLRLEDTGKTVSVVATVLTTNGARSYPALISCDSTILFARPLSWSKIWKQKKGKVDLYVWRAEAPPDFVALGDVATQSHDAPVLDNYRCVHKALLAAQPLGAKLWDDSGKRALMMLVTKY